MQRGERTRVAFIVQGQHTRAAFATWSEFDPPPRRFLFTLSFSLPPLIRRLPPCPERAARYTARSKDLRPVAR